MPPPKKKQKQFPVDSSQRKLSDFCRPIQESETLPNNHETSEKEQEEPDNINGSKQPSGQIEDPVVQPSSSCSNHQKTNDLAKEEVIGLIKQHFGKALEEGKLHNFYTCVGKCSALPDHEIQRIKADKTGKADQSKKKGPDMFRHDWLLDRKLSYCEHTGLWWLVYVEGQGMYCLLCRLHNTTNKYNKQNTFNVTPSTNYKRSAVHDHKDTNGHVSTHACEIERRNSSLVALKKEADETRDKVTYNAFLCCYWLGKEEVANRKLVPLLDLQKQVGNDEMKHFRNTSERSQQDMRVLLGQLIKDNLIEQVQEAKWFSVLVDEVTDCSTTEQLLIYVGYVSAQGEAQFKFLDCQDVLENSDSPDAATITHLIIQELKACNLDTKYLCGFGSDGASVMTGSSNGVGVRLQAVAPRMLRSHCISHRLALACGDANDEVKYISTVETILRQLWKWLEYPKRSSAFVKVCKSLNTISLTNKTEKQKKLRKRLATKIQRACRTRWLSTGQSVDSVCRNLVALMLTLRQFKEQDATAHGLLTRMKTAKFIGTLLLLNMVLPHLNALSKLFQKDHTCYVTIKPALQSTKAALEALRCTTDIVKELELAISDGGAYADLELEMSERDPVRVFLHGIQKNYIAALERNLERRFTEASPVFQGFSAFDPTVLPAKAASNFQDYGSQEIQVLAEKFRLDIGETLAEWQNFKYLMLEWNIPDAVLRGADNEISPTHFVLKKMVKEQAAYKVGFNNLVQLAQICLTQPLSNAVVERGASAVKRIKTRLRCNLKNKMLASLMQISLNGPSTKSEECGELLSDAALIWRKTHVRNLPPMKQLPRIGGSAHTDSYYPLVTVDCGSQTDLTEMPPLRQSLEEEQLQQLQSNLDENVQVQPAQISGDVEYHDALQALGMDDKDPGLDSGLDSDYESDY